jgi:hypothetical protein
MSIKLVRSSTKSPQQVAKNCIINPKHRNSQKHRNQQREAHTDQKEILRTVAKLPKKLQNRDRKSKLS